jgi:hypothetical protein
MMSKAKQGLFHVAASVSVFTTLFWVTPHFVIDEHRAEESARTETPRGPAPPATTPRGPALSATMAQGRNLHLYDAAGPYEFGFVPLRSPGRETAVARRAEMRAFLWRHWQQRRLAYVVGKSTNNHGEPVILHFLVEPDETGTWRIAVMIELRPFDRGGVDEPWPHIYQQAAYDVKRTRWPSDGREAEALANEDVLPSSHYLTLFDKDGEFLMNI